MRLSQAWIIATHDLALLRRRRGLMAALVAFPIGVSLAFPALVSYIIGQAAPTANPATYLPPLIDAFSFWFIIGAATLPNAIASYSVVGEKIEHSLEPLLATPTTDGEILLGKVLAAFLPTIVVLGAGGVLFMTLINRVTRSTFGYNYYPNGEMTVLLLALAPVVVLFAIETSILISSKVTDVRSAQQYAGLLYLPLILFYLAGETGAWSLDSTHLLEMAAAFAVGDLGLFVLARWTFHREAILTRWN